MPRVQLSEAILTDSRGSFSLGETLAEKVFQRQVETKVLIYLSLWERENLMFG